MTDLKSQEKISFSELFLSRDQPFTRKALASFVLTLALLLNLYHLYAGYFGPPDAHTFRSIHLSLLLILTFLTKPFVKGEKGSTRKLGAVVDPVLIALVIACQVYVSYDIIALSNRIGDLNQYDIIMGTIMVALVLEATRRVIGWAMVIICIIFLFHTLQADKFFGFLYGPPTSWTKIMDLVVIQDHGLYGIPIMVSASYIMLFLIFGAILIESGAGLFFTRIALALTGRQTGGPAKAAVVASGIMGTLSGAAVANVVMTGSFTIPLMKRVGYRPYFAGAVEAAASSGGLIMPPIMGAAAFIMAMFLNKPYLDIAIAGAVPAILYFFSIFCGVHFEAKRQGLAAIPKDELPDLWTEARRGGHLFISIVALILFLAVGRSVGLAAFWAIVSVFFLTFLRPDTRLTPVRVLAAFEKAASSAIPVAISCASAGIVIGCVFSSGVGVKFSGAIIALAHNQLWKTGVTAFTIGLAKYLLPFMFVFSTELFLIGSFWSVSLAVTSATIGIVALSAGVSGFLKGPCTIFERLTLLAASLLLIKPGLAGDLVGFGLVGLVLLSQWRLTARKQEANAYGG